MKALVMGGTGAIGQHLVKHLLLNDQVAKVGLLTRRDSLDTSVWPNTAKLQVIKFDFEKPQADVLTGFDTFFCTHGTTRALAGSAEAFVKIDRDYVLNTTAEFTKVNGKDIHMLIVTAVGTDKNSWFLYPRTKGELEEALKQMQLKRLSILRPAMLKGRPDDGRIAEKIGEFLVKLDFGEYASVKVEDVAKAMVKLAFKSDDTPVQTYGNRAIVDIAHEYQ